MLNIIGVIEFI